MTRSRRAAAAAGAALLLALTMTGVAGASTGGDGLFAILKGEKEVPGPGDPNGAGAAIVTLYPNAHKVCARISWDRIGSPLAAHIHEGTADVAGPVVVDLTGSVTGGPNCATGVARALIRDIKAHPRRYYVNVHNEAYPAGAIRGQLRG